METQLRIESARTEQERSVITVEDEQIDNIDDFVGKLHACLVSSTTDAPNRCSERKRREKWRPPSMEEDWVVLCQARYPSVRGEEWTDTHEKFK